jgi:SAM-dependent methyltransferase
VRSRSRGGAARLSGGVVAQEQTNAELWQSAQPTSTYANRVLRPVEVVLLARYREALSGRVLELGCGAGRLLGYFVALGAQTHGVDVSPAMVEYCRRAYPPADVRVGDLKDIARTWDGGPLDAIFASYNVIDVLDDAHRRRVLSDLKGLLAPDGLAIISTHNLDAVRAAADGTGAQPHATRGELIRTALDRPPSWVFQAVRKLAARRRNRRRLGALEERHEQYAILNDDAHNYGLLHYYITRDEQERQLQELGYELMECLDLEGERVGAGEQSRSGELHYVARVRRDGDYTPAP